METNRGHTVSYEHTHIYTWTKDRHLNAQRQSQSGLNNWIILILERDGMTIHINLVSVDRWHQDCVGCHTWMNAAQHKLPQYFRYILNPIRRCMCKILEDRASSVLKICFHHLNTRNKDLPSVGVRTLNYFFSIDEVALTMVEYVHDNLSMGCASSKTDSALSVNIYIYIYIDEMNFVFNRCCNHNDDRAIVIFVWCTGDGFNSELNITGWSILSVALCHQWNLWSPCTIKQLRLEHHIWNSLVKLIGAFILNVLGMCKKRLVL